VLWGYKNGGWGAAICSGASSANPGRTNLVFRNNLAQYTKYAGINWDTKSWTTQGMTIDHNRTNVPASEFVDVNASNFRFKSTTTASIDDGIVIAGINDTGSESPYAGGAPDLGAYEYNGVDWAAGSTVTPPSFPSGGVGIFTDNQDIGSPDLMGSASFSNGDYTVKGSGADIWGQSGQFHYVYKNHNDNGEIVACVASVQNTNTWAKAGVMFRNGLATNAPFAMVIQRPDKQVCFQWRTAAGANAQGGSLTGGTSSIKYACLRRQGNDFSAYYSTTSATGPWTQIGEPQTIVMEARIKAGLCVTSHDNTKLCTATFNQVSVTGVPDAPGMLEAMAVSSGQIELSWNDHSNNETGFKIERKPGSGGTWAQIGTAGENAGDYVDNANLTPVTIYFYRARAYNAFGDSGYSNEAEVATPAVAYEEWAQRAGLAGTDAQPSAMPFGDGVPNMHKYAFNMDGTKADYHVLTPGVGVSGLPHIKISQSGEGGMVLRFEYLKRIGSNLIYTPQTGTTLQEGLWTPLSAPPGEIIDAEWERVICEAPFDPQTTPSFFGRLKITMP
jgi:hypothetical protein